MQLPQTPDPVLFSRLRRAVEFLQHAISHSTLSSPLDRMVAVHGLDNAAEYLLRIVLDHFDVEGRTGKTLSTVEMAALATEVSKFLYSTFGLQLPYQTELKKLRQLRNMVQHGMIDPVSELGHLRTVVERFYEYLFEKLFGLNPQELRTSSLIRAQIPRQHLFVAETRIAEGAFGEAVVSCRDAFENALLERQWDSVLWREHMPAVLSTPSGATRLIYNGLLERIEVLSLEVNMRQYARFKNCIDEVPFDFKAEPVPSTARTNWTRSDAEFCYQFVAQTLLAWQNSEIDEPERSGTVTGGDWSTEHWFGDVRVPPGTRVVFHDGEKLKLEPQTSVYVADAELEDALHSIPLNVEIDCRSTTWYKGIVVAKTIERTVVREVASHLLTNNPPRWKVGIRHEPVALTWYRQDFEGGRLRYESPCINTASARAIKGIFEWSFTEDVVQQILQYREEHGPFRTEDDIRAIPGISEDHIYWICRYTRAASHRPLPTEPNL